MEPVRLLWTAGFDSTYRLLELMQAGRTVQPYYVIDRDRRSYPIELQRIAELRRLIAARYPEPARLRPVAITLRDDLSIEPDLQEAWDTLARQTHIGTQYLWLAQFCHHAGFPDGSVKLCMPRIDPPHPLQLIKFEDLDAEELRLRPGAPQVLFRFYAWPTRHASKADMRTAAVERGFWDILQRSWFCHTPVGPEPCGHCGPCRIARVQREDVSFAGPATLRLAAWRARSRLRRLGRALGGGPKPAP